MNNSKSFVIQNYKIYLSSKSWGSEVYRKSDLNCRIHQDWSKEYSPPPFAVWIPSSSYASSQTSSWTSF